MSVVPPPGSLSVGGKSETHWQTLSAPSIHWPAVASSTAKIVSFSSCAIRGTVRLMGSDAPNHGAARTV